MAELILSPGGRRYGYKKQSPDHRDLGMVRFTGAPRVIPPSYDLEPFCGPKKNQLSLGSCTAFAGSGNREYLARKFEGKSPVLSPLFLYWMERYLDGTLSDGDTGSNGRTDCKAMNQFGICLESDLPYDPMRFQVEPTDLQKMGATYYKAGAYHSIGTVQDMKECVASDYPVLIGFQVYESFEGGGIATTGLMTIPDVQHERSLGGHEVLVIGYDDNKVGTGWTGAFKVRNSWGDTWGDKGNFWMPYQFAADPNLLWDAWMQHLGKPW